ncbi:MAG TPA: hypothetical protein VK184_16585 [Nostocaceae cyanobacterium]|nr:hypothetical protein [Nostocaceae cyanobacterium]
MTYLEDIITEIPSWQIYASDFLWQLCYKLLVMLAIAKHFLWKKINLIAYRSLEIKNLIIVSSNKFPS